MINHFAAYLYLSGVLSMQFLLRRAASIKCSAELSTTYWIKLDVVLIKFSIMYNRLVHMPAQLLIFILFGSTFVVGSTLAMGWIVHRWQGMTYTAIYTHFRWIDVFLINFGEIVSRILRNFVDNKWLAVLFEVFWNIFKFSSFY